MPTRSLLIVSCRSAVLICLILLSTLSGGCNLFSKLDSPGETRDQYAAAIALANDGRCAEARDLLQSIIEPNDDVHSALGWAHLCIAGATASKIATSLYKYSGNSSDLTVVGTLARTIVPMSGNKMQALNEAKLAFEQIAEHKRRDLQVAISHFTLAAGQLANQAGNDGGGGLTRDDISGAGCTNDAASCATSTNCTVGPTGMSDGAVAGFTSSISAAATALRATGAADLQSLANALNTGFAGDAGRCFIFNRTIPNP